MNEVILHFDNASYEEVERLKVKLGFDHVDELLAYLIEAGYDVIENAEGRDPARQEGPVEIEVTDDMRQRLQHGAEPMLATPTTGVTWHSNVVATTGPDNITFLVNAEGERMINEAAAEWHMATSTQTEVMPLAEAAEIFELTPEENAHLLQEQLRNEELNWEMERQQMAERSASTPTF